MTHPAFENVTEMEAFAAGEADDEAHLRLRHNGFSTRWLRVRWYSTGYRYWEIVGRDDRDITRKQAQALIDLE